MTSMFVHIHKGIARYYDRTGVLQAEGRFSDSEQERARLCGLGRYLGYTILFVSEKHHDTNRKN